METTTSVTEQLIDKIKKMSPEQQRRLLDILDDGPVCALEEPQISDQQGSQRRYARKSYFMTVDYAIKDRCFRDFIKDVSAGGVFIETHHLFPIGETISLSFMVPHHAFPVKINGKIVRVVPNGLGIEFAKDDEEQVEELKAVLNSF